ncbi:MAG: aspartate carbamoyltransferase [Planctomycetota bacterium]|jgi:aspartate carbamoyltransferase catalytic subunit
MAARFKGRDVISIRDFTIPEIRFVLDTARRIEKTPDPLLQGRVLSNLFFEPSTRTRLSFESAMARLGGSHIGFADAAVSSTAKGESLHDTIRVVEGYCDVIVLRHPREGAARVAAEATSLPVINGGDGSNQHPTQTLIDLYTIRESCKRVTDLSIGFLGDLKYGRAAHGLVEAAAMLGNRLTLISPTDLRLPKRLLDEARERGAEARQVKDLDKVVGDLDVLYVTRIQRERFPDSLEFERVRNAYRLDRKALEAGGEGLCVLHPLPRVEEISPEVDDMDGALYFRQAHNGVTVRKALLALLLGEMP